METRENKRSWKPMNLNPVGYIDQVVEATEGKVTPEAVDTGGEPNTKPPGDTT